MVLETKNVFRVTARNGCVAVGFAKAPLSPYEAVQFAAWLVLAADDCLVPSDQRHDFGDGKLDPLKDLVDTVEAIRAARRGAR